MHRVPHDGCCGGGSDVVLLVMTVVVVVCKCRIKRWKREEGWGGAL